ncbi:MAG: hypothetical protein ACE5E6_00490 [Phycisphaerae bacterium]
MIVIPAVYVGLAARAPRCGTGIRRGTGILPVSSAISLLTLALGWTLVEAVLHLQSHLGPQDGLLTGSAGDAPHLHWLARLLAYVATAFLVACANASLVTVLGAARLSFPASRSLLGSPNVVAWEPSRVVLPTPPWTLRHAHPRAPPIHIGVATYFMLGVST